VGCGGARVVGRWPGGGRRRRHPAPCDGTACAGRPGPSTAARAPAAAPANRCARRRAHASPPSNPLSLTLGSPWASHSTTSAASPASAGVRPAGARSADRALAVALSRQGPAGRRRHARSRRRAAARAEGMHRVEGGDEPCRAASRALLLATMEPAPDDPLQFATIEAASGAPAVATEAAFGGARASPPPDEPPPPPYESVVLGQSVVLNVREEIERERERRGGGGAPPHRVPRRADASGRHPSRSGPGTNRGIRRGRRRPCRPRRRRGAAPPVHRCRLRPGQARGGRVGAWEGGGGGGWGGPGRGTRDGAADPLPVRGRPRGPTSRTRSPPAPQVRARGPRPPLQSFAGSPISPGCAARCARLRAAPSRRRSPRARSWANTR